MKFFGSERKLVPAFEKLARAIAWDGRVAAEKNAVHSDLAHSLSQQRCILLPQSRDRNAGSVKITTPDPGISAFDRLGIHTERLIHRAIITAASGQMRDLHRDIRCCREQALEEDPCLLRPVGMIVVDVRMGVNDKGHTVRIRGRENRACTLDVFIKIEIHVPVERNHGAG